MRTVQLATWILKEIFQYHLSYASMRMLAYNPLCQFWICYDKRKKTGPIWGANLAYYLNTQHLQIAMRVSFSLSSIQGQNPSMASGSGSLVWFRKGLRLHDNPALEYASKDSDFLYPIFVIDSHYMKPDPNSFSPGSSRAGLNRIRFLLESLVDLNSNLKKLGSRLLVLKGEPGDVLIRCLQQVMLALNLWPLALRNIIFYLF